MKKPTLKAVFAAVVAFLLSPQARRYEIALGIGIYAAVHAVLTGHPA